MMISAKMTNKTFIKHRDHFAQIQEPFWPYTGAVLNKYRGRFDKSEMDHSDKWRVGRHGSVGPSWWCCQGETVMVEDRHDQHPAHSDWFRDAALPYWSIDWTHSGYRSIAHSLHMMCAMGLTNWTELADTAIIYSSMGSYQLIEQTCLTVRCISHEIFSMSYSMDDIFSYDRIYHLHLCPHGGGGMCFTAAQNKKSVRIR